MNSVSIRPHRGPCRVLVIDDDELARESVIDLLNEAGFTASGLASPIGATKELLEKEIEVVILDVMMPSIRGDKFATLLRQNPRLRSLGVVLISGASAEELHDFAEQIDAAAVIEKAELDHRLVSAVEHARRAAHL